MFDPVRLRRGVKFGFSTARCDSKQADEASEDT